MNLWTYLGNRSGTFIVFLALLMTLAVGVPDYLLGPGYGFSIFYLIPISLSAWYAGRLAGVFTACISAVVWYFAEELSQAHAASAYEPLWNTLVRIGFFGVVVLLITAFKREKSFAREDYLTGLGNRRFFFELASAEIGRSARYRHPFTLAYIDIDGFKSVNDRLGHDEGDRLLRDVADTIKSSIRSTDIAARLGGDEFAVLLPESGRDAATVFFNKLHERLTSVAAAGDRKATLSIGVATFIDPPASIDEMIRIVDRIMYTAKSGGRNRVRYETFS
jgi:diguanylate cyclase (GGDEF)-like protein